MGQPAARVGDMHVCPMFDGPKPHVGGPVLPAGVPTVLIGGMPAATVGTLCTCASAPDVIVRGSATVRIGGRPAARLGDNTAHGGMIVMGCPTVLIGDFGMAAISIDFTVVGNVAVSKMYSATQTADRKIKHAEADDKSAAQIQTAISAAQSGSPFMEKC
ncbi:PAAR domain-containing protein [Fibrisoma limi]|uniref:PAAR domain-containing protein n=1 Tax=Fibrisoma limi TaxID=663275 RepID=UPI0005880192|nr:PAAR domain-containing protein [Fibrisoma limi]